MAEAEILIIQKKLINQQELEDIILEIPMYYKNDQQTITKQFFLYENKILYLRAKQKNKQPNLFWVTVIYFSFNLKVQFLYKLNDVEAEQMYAVRFSKNHKFLELYFVSNINQMVLDTFKKAVQRANSQSNFDQQFKMNQLLGQGGFAKVMKISQIKAPFTKYACKVFDKTKLKNQNNWKKEISVEIEIMNSLLHENIIKFHQLFESGNSIYLVLDLCLGGTLKNSLHRTYNESMIAVFAYRMLLALQHMAQNQIVHRDLKEENILFKTTDDAKHLSTPIIADFGLATKTTYLNQLFYKCGTPGYIAPEVLRLPRSEELKNKKQAYINEKLDIFSLGVIIYRLIEGKQLFNAQKTEELLMQNKFCQINLKNMVNNTKTGIKEFLEGMLANEPKKRFTIQQALSSEWILTIAQPSMSSVENGISKIGQSIEEIQAQQLKDQSVLNLKNNINLMKNQLEPIIEEVQQDKISNLNIQIQMQDQIRESQQEYVSQVNWSGVEEIQEGNLTPTCTEGDLSMVRETLFQMNSGITFNVSRINCFLNFKDIKLLNFSVTSQVNLNLQFPNIIKVSSFSMLPVQKNKTHSLSPSEKSNSSCSNSAKVASNQMLKSILIRSNIYGSNKGYINQMSMASSQNSLNNNHLSIEQSQQSRLPSNAPIQLLMPDNSEQKKLIIKNYNILRQNKKQNQENKTKKQKSSFSKKQKKVLKGHKTSSLKQIIEQNAEDIERIIKKIAQNYNYNNTIKEVNSKSEFTMGIQQQNSLYNSPFTQHRNMFSQDQKNNASLSQFRSQLQDQKNNS